MNFEIWINNLHKLKSNVSKQTTPHPVSKPGKIKGKEFVQILKFRFYHVIIKTKTISDRG